MFNAAVSEYKHSPSVKVLSCLYNKFNNNLIQGDKTRKAHTHKNKNKNKMKTEAASEDNGLVEKLIVLMGLGDIFDEARRMTKRQVRRAATTHTDEQ